ncbi:ribosome biogenesis regulatory protein homolog [Artemia franciscana]|uniref:Ribosome biogenesis regulatory protein n=1 Tax=Artemia franciscana TaxID=6661 RepID=A0AA88IUQ4_ARTSF|nr:hypothetical protein QYM36_008269 [Artemia franciscana]
MTDVIVSEVLQKLSEKEELLQSIHVSKHLQPEVDLGNLLLNDLDEIDLGNIKTNKEEYLLSLSRDNLQYLVNKLYELPTERVDEVIVAKIPEPILRIPREKRVPKDKPLTKWEQYAKDKGIKKQKKSKLIWDEELNRWVPRFGFKKALAEKEKNWVMPVAKNVNPNEDQFAKANRIKEEKVAKNELKRLQNIARNTKKAKKPVLEPAAKYNTDQLNRMVHVAHTATASMGKFQKKLKDEKTIPKTGKRSHFQPLISDSAAEKSHNLEILDRVQSKKPKLDIEKAVNRMTRAEEEERHEHNKGGKKKKSKGGKKGKGKFRGGTGKKGKGKGAPVKKAGKGKR